MFNTHGFLLVFGLMGSLAIIGTTYFHFEKYVILQNIMSQTTARAFLVIAIISCFAIFFKIFNKLCKTPIK